MYNWRLLLLAFVAILQPIASFTERNLVDGRQQCCDHRLERDSTYSLYGNSRLKLPAENQRVTTQRREIREERRDETRHENFELSRLPINSFRNNNERENRRSIEFRFRSSHTQYQQGESAAQTWKRVSQDRDITRKELRDTRSDRIRIAAQRRNLSRDFLIRNSRVYQINRNSNSRITRDAIERYMIQTDERRSTASQRDTRHMQIHDEIHSNRDNRETRVELRRTRDTLARTERPTIARNQRSENGMSHENNVRNVRTFERPSKGNHEYRRFSLETNRDNIRNGQEHVDGNLRSDNERRNTEMSFRERMDRERQGISRTIIPQWSDTIRDRRSVSNRAYEIDELRNNVRNSVTYRNERRNVNVRDENEQYRDKRITGVEDRRSSEMTTRLAEKNRVSRLSDLRERMFNENRRIGARDSISYSTQDTNKQSRQIARVIINNARRDDNRELRETQNFRERIKSEERPVRDHQLRMIASRNHRFEATQRQRNIIIERQSNERMNNREFGNVRNDERRETRNADLTREVSRVAVLMSRTDSREEVTERLTRERATSESNRLSSKNNARENTRGLNVRDGERRETRSADRTRELSRSTVSMRRIESSVAVNERLIRERATPESNRLSLRMNPRENARDRHNVREGERREIRDADRIREVSRDNISMRRIEITPPANGRQTRERTTSESHKGSSRIHDQEIAHNRHNVRDDERRDIYNADRTRELSRNIVLMRRIESRTALNKRLTRERAISESRLSSRIDNRENANNRHNVRDNERREIRNADLTREISRNVVSRSRIDSHTAVNERLTRERVTSESNRPSFRNDPQENARDRHNVRNEERREVRSADRIREVSRETDTLRRIESRVPVNDRLTREVGTSEFNRLTSRMNDRVSTRDQHNVRDNERRETRNTDRSRDVSRGTISMRRIDSQNRLGMNSVRINSRQKIIETEATEYNWQYMIYALQVIYLCSIFMPISLNKTYTKNTKHIGWWTSFQGAIKAD